MKLYVVVYGSTDLTDDNIEQKFWALCPSLKIAQEERAYIAAKTNEPTGILVFSTEYMYDGCFIVEDIIEE